MQNIIIRNATIKDREKIAEIKIEGWQTAYRGIIDDNFLDSMDKEQEVKKRRTNIENGVNIIVGELNNEVIGFCLYRNYIKEPEKYPNANCEISSLYVKSTLKRKGIGTKLMQHVIQKLQNQGKTKMILGCLKENYPSRAFYEKMGGKPLKFEKITFGNKEYEEIIYEYDISKMNNTYQLVPYIDKYYNFIYNVKKNAYKEYVKKYWGEWNDKNQMIRFKKSMEENKNNTYIILYKNEKIGFYQGKLANEDTYYIENICIVTEYQRKGIGTKILSDIIKKYKDYNIEIQYFKNNPVGNLYKKLGFNIYDETEFHYKMKKKR